MPLKTKIVLSDKELALVKNEDFILTKQVIIQKVYEILSQGTATIDTAIPIIYNGTGFPIEPPKISKGENYLGLPYVTLDHPRLFNKSDIFAVRTMFWWGHFFSITFHAAGNYKEIFSDRILANYSEVPDGLFICIHKEQWHHHFEEDNYMPVNKLSTEQMQTIIAAKSFIKIALKFPLEHFNNIRELLDEGYKKIGKLIA